MMSLDRFDAFTTFAAIAEANSFAGAARKLGRSPAVVTRTLAALEAELGTQLFRRTTRVVTLTEAGTRFLGDVRRILGDVEESTGAIRSADAALRGSFVLTASVMFGELYVTNILLAFLARHPEVRARALLVDRVVDLVGEGVDVAVRIAHLPDSLLRAAKVGAVRRVLCASPKYLDAAGRPQAPRDLADHATIAFALGTPPREWILPQKRGSHRVRLEPRLVVNSTRASIAAALAGHGIVRALSYQVASEVRAGKLEIILPDHEPAPLPIHVVHASGDRPPARVRAFVDFAVERLRRDERLDLDKWSG